MTQHWHNHEGYRAIYLAALTGVYANPDFNGCDIQGRQDTAHNIAKRAVEAAIADLEEGDV